MHAPIRDRLEDLLSADKEGLGDYPLAQHLSSCSECSSELRAMKAQSEMLHSLRAPNDSEPAPGFYARVMQRIEQRAKESIWASLIYSPFASRLTYASLTLAVVLGGYVIAQESRDGHLSGPVMVAQRDVPVIGTQAQQRDAVLENFATH